MKTFQKTILSAAIVMVVMASCSKDGAAGPTGPQGPNGPALSGTLEGYVDLFDQYGDLMTPATGVYVTIPGKTGIDSTSAAGMFSANLTTGTYQLNLAKTGYGATEVPSLNFVGGGTQYITAHIQMSQPASFALTGVTLATNTVTNTISATVTPTSTNTKACKVICFISNQNTVSSAPANYMGSITINIAANAITGVANIPTATLNSSGIVSGNTLYVAAYPISVNNTASTYPDMTTGKTIYNNLGSSMVTANILVP